MYVPRQQMTELYNSQVILYLKRGRSTERVDAGGLVSHSFLGRFSLHGLFGKVFRSLDLVDGNSKKGVANGRKLRQYGVQSGR